MIAARFGFTSPAASGRVRTFRVVRRLLLLVVALAAATIVSSQPAFAHGDARLANDVVTLRPGEAVEFREELHYHRLVARVVADGPVLVEMIDARSGEVVLRGGPERELRFNDLVRCCDDAGWSPFILRVENAGDSEFTADIRATLAHDDLAVTVYGAESFTREPILILGAIWAVILWRTTRKRDESLTLRRAAIMTALLVAVTFGITLYGGVRYGFGVVPAFLAGVSDSPLVPPNWLVSGTSVMLVITGTAWGLAGVWWARAHKNANRIAWVALGTILTGLVILTAALIASTYGSIVVPIIAMFVAAVPLVAVLGMGIRSRSDAIAVQ